MQIVGVTLFGIIGEIQAYAAHREQNQNDKRNRNSPDQGSAHGLAFESVARAAHSYDADRLSRVRFNLLAQPAHMHVHRAAVANILPPPDAFQDKLTGKDFPAMLG